MKLTGKNYIGETLSSEGKISYQGVDPSQQEVLPGDFYNATEQEINRTMEKASGAFLSYRNTSGEQRARFLETMAEEIELLDDRLISRAMEETGLPEGRLAGERGRTTNQLKMFAALLREGSWLEASIDTAIPDRQPVAKPDIRKMLVPLGPVVVFSASNFPLAFSVAGGDTASVLAGGNPVIVKAHPGHPGTSELVASSMIKAAKKTGMPDGTISMLHGNSYETGRRLVMHPSTRAVAFTGSLQGGKALFDLAAGREDPIPVFAEMGSINPVFVLRDAIQKRSMGIAGQLASSVNLGAGQFCTKPGIIVVSDSENTPAFIDQLAGELSAQSNGTMLGKRISDGYRKSIGKLMKSGSIDFLTDPELNGNSHEGVPALAVVSASEFIKTPTLHEEVFGPYSLVVTCKNSDEMNGVAKKLEGQLTITVIAEAEEFIRNGNLIHTLSQKAGRLIRNGVPTGVEVCSSMQHGGPFPATTDSRFTSVGTSAIRRFVRPLAFQDWIDGMLPAALQNANPLKIWRMVNGKWTQDAI